MPQPAVQDVHIDEVLTSRGMSFMQSQDVYLATKVFPIIRVDKQSNKYIVWERNDWLRDEVEKRADATESVGSGYRFSQDSYFADVWAFHKDVGSQARANQDAFVDLDGGAVRFITRKMLIRMEIQWVTDFFTTGVWGSDVTVTTTWDDVASDPIEDIEAEIETMLTTTGFRVNTMVIGYRAFRRLKNHPDIKELIKYTGSAPTLVTPQIVSQVFNIPNIYVAEAIKATNLEGETEAYSQVFGNHCWIGYVSPTPAIDEPSAGYIFNWDYAGYGTNMVIDSFELRRTKSTRYEIEAAWDGKVTAADLGVFFPNVVP